MQLENIALTHKSNMNGVYELSWSNRVARGVSGEGLKKEEEEKDPFYYSNAPARNINYPALAELTHRYLRS